MVKSSRNNGGRGANARLCAWDGREEGGEDGAIVLYCQVTTIGSWLELLEPVVIYDHPLTAGLAHSQSFSNFEA
jgi:hypothetical protein